MEDISKKEKRKNMNKSEIIDAAEKLFFSKGYSNSTMDEIAKEAGFTKRTLYSYFTSKEEMYEKIVERGYIILNKLFLEVLNKKKNSSEIFKIRALGYSFLEFEAENRGYFKAIFESEYSYVGSEELEQTIIELLQNCIREGIRKGEIIDTVDEASISLILWSTLMGFVTTFIRKEAYIKDHFKKEVKDVIENGLDFILNSIKAHGK
ncbi:TetR/AcrR family transcriptional regulator [Clostridium sp.]|uniref:TetR/AcrR family transcriptional regulator n=1 Tax=Clostridium sp. TaxID=1506 RepID=UPI002841DF22|nr:TetR/AcrR family transcriptional regulator [Clostridium sp.]MDR3597319.1 TetR/AcrR family transcriptional regulator [Clostridium sp.]